MVLGGSGPDLLIVRKNHVVTRDVGNLRGFSTASIFVRPSNVADRAINLQRAPDTTTQLRRGYQCQIAAIGGMGTGTFDNPSLNLVQTVTINTDGFLYNKLEKQIFFYYDGQVTGAITGISQADPAEVTSVAHELATGAILILRDINGMVDLNNHTYTITVVDDDHFTLNGVNSSTFPMYINGGIWSIAFADQRYLNFTIFTDPRYLTTNPGWSIGAWSLTPWGAPSGESITCNITVNRAAQIVGNFTNVNTFDVQFGHELAAGDIIQFYAVGSIFNQRNVLSVTPTSITFDGFPVTVANNTYVSQFFDIPFRKGFDVISPYLISTFIATITDPVTGIYGLQVAINGLSNLAAAFIQIIEPVIIDSNNTFILNYWYWQKVNSTINPPFPGSANPVYQNSANFENASFAAFDDVIFIANGLDYPQKFDGQTVYRAGMPIGVRPNSAADNTVSTIKPFVMGNVYQYAITYVQIDNLGHLVESQLSPILQWTVEAANAAIDLTVTNLISSPGANWNTNTAIATAQTATVYGPDDNGFYYDLVTVNTGFTLKIGDSAYYSDLTAGTFNGTQTGSMFNIDAGHVIFPGDFVYFVDSGGVERRRFVTATTATSMTIAGTIVTVTDDTMIQVYKIGVVFGDVAIVNGTQTDVNNITVLIGHTVQIGDIVDFLDSSNNLQRRNITNTSGTSVTIDGIPVSIFTGTLISSENQRTNAINIQRSNFGAATFAANSIISNNLRINIYRTLQGVDYSVIPQIYLVASIPNNGLGTGTQIYTDVISDPELGGQFQNGGIAKTPPPISKYLRSFGTQMFYAGGERGNSLNSDRVFFSESNNPEIIAADPQTGVITNAFNVPNVDDDITGIGVAGTTFVITKNNSLWACTGQTISGQIEVIQIAPGSNIGCVAHATIASVGTLMYFCHTNGVYAISENQLYPTDPFGNPIPLSLPIDTIFRQTNYIPQTRYILRRAVATNYPKDNQYLLFLPCENPQTTIRDANTYSILLCYDYYGKNWYLWNNMNAAGGMFVIRDNLYFQERRFSGVNGNVANLYKQHRFYRLVDHADHAGAQFAEWRSSWEDLGQPEVRKKFCRCILLMDRISELLQYNNPIMNFSSYVNRIPNLQNTITTITQTDNVRNSSWSYSGWGWNYWSGYQDSFVTVNLKGGTVAKSMQVGFTIQGINMDIRLSGFQLEVIPENRKTVVR